MLSMHSEETLVSQALEAGARGYVLKNAVDLDLVSAVKSIASGMTVLDPQVSRKDALKDRKSTRLNSSHVAISYAVFCLKKKRRHQQLNSSAIPFDRTSNLQQHRPHSRARA